MTERRHLKGGEEGPEACRIYAVLGNIWRFKTFYYLHEHPENESSPIDIYKSIGAPSYFVVQWSLRVLADAGLVAHRGRSGGNSLFGLTPRGTWVADVLSQIDELASV